MSFEHLFRIVTSDGKQHKIQPFDNQGGNRHLFISENLGKSKIHAKAG